VSAERKNTLGWLVIGYAMQTKKCVCFCCGWLAATLAATKAWMERTPGWVIFKALVEIGAMYYPNCADAKSRSFMAYSVRKHPALQRLLPQP